MGVHSVAVVLEERLGHEGHGFAGLIGHILRHVLVQHHVVGGTQKRLVTKVNFRLAAGGNLVMMAFHLHTAALHGKCHFGAEVLVVIGRRDWKVALFVAGAVPKIGFSAPGVPAAFVGIHEVVSFVLVLVEADVIEDEELGLCAEVGGVSEAGRS